MKGGVVKKHNCCIALRENRRDSDRIAEDRIIHEIFVELFSRGLISRSIRFWLQTRSTNLEAFLETFFIPNSVSIISILMHLHLFISEGTGTFRQLKLFNYRLISISFSSISIHKTYWNFQRGNTTKIYESNAFSKSKTLDTSVDGFRDVAPRTMLFTTILPCPSTAHI